jgi:hypothetical protein
MAVCLQRQTLEIVGYNFLNNDAGYDDGRNEPFNHDTYDHCANNGEDGEYYDGFIDGCMSVEDNTRDVCESATDA